MQKTGFKTFVYSFSVSLFAIFAANSAYLRAYPSANQDIKIPSKNVTLFLKNDALNPSVKAVPVKKIALNVLPDLQKEVALPPVDAGVVYEPPQQSSDVIMAEAFIPLESSTDSFDIADATDINEPDFAEAKVVSTKSIPPMPKDVPSDDVLPLQKSGPTPQELKHIEKPKPTLVAQAEAPKTEPAPAKTLQLTENSLPQPIFPLEKSRDDLSAGKQIKFGEPEKLNQVALADKTIPIRSMENEKAIAPEPPSWERMSNKKTDADSPWVVAKGAGASKNNLLKEEEFYKKENQQVKAALDVSVPKDASGSVQIASDTVKNLLIPIPEDILNDENLIPQLSYVAKDSKEATKESDKAIAAADKSDQENKVIVQAPAATDSPQAPTKDNLLSSLNTIFSSSTKVKENKQNSNSDKKGDLFAELQNKLKANKKITIMPTEMRLSFQPNRAEISGQTLRWIQAFAAKAADDKLMSLEIRIDGTSEMDLQQKRLNLLHNILTNKGVEYSKINTVFTSREPNSFIIRTVTANNDRRGINRNNNTQTAGHYLQW